MNPRAESSMRMVLGLIVAACVIALGWTIAVHVLGCAAVEDNLSPIISSPASTVSTGDDSSVFVLQAAGGGGGAVLWSLAVWYFGRRTLVKAGKRLIAFNEVNLGKEERQRIRLMVCKAHVPRPIDTVRQSTCTCDPAEHWINKQVKANRKAK